jgi:hypothetical protein
VESTGSDLISGYSVTAARALVGLGSPTHELLSRWKPEGKIHVSGLPAVR